MVILVLVVSTPIASTFADDESTDLIKVRNPQSLPAKMPCERIALGETGDYKPCIARLPSGELLVVAFHGHKLEGGKYREDMILFRSGDGGKTWGERQVLPLLGREPYFSVLEDGTLFITTHLLTQDMRNELGYIHGYLHRSADEGKTWTTLKIAAEDVPGAAPKTWTHTSRNVLELEDGSLVLGVSAGSSIDYLWRSRDKGKSWDKSLACTVQGFDVAKQGFPWHAETVFTQAANGDILGIARCHSSALPPLAGTEVAVGNDQVERMALFRSRDRGKTWTLEPEMGNYYGEMYQAFLRLSDGRLLLTFTVRALRPPLGVHAVLGKESSDGFKFDFEHDRIVIDEKTPLGKSSGGGFGPTVQLDDGTLVTSYSYRTADDQTHLEVARWRLPAAADEASAAGTPFAKQEVRRLSVHDVGEYAAIPWGKPGTPIAPGSREDRVRDLNLSITSLNVSENMTEDQLDSWSATARRGRTQGKKFLPRLYFWAGDRVSGPLRDVDFYWRRLDRFLGGMESRHALGDFCGIVLAEENVFYSGRPAVLAELYRRIKAKYTVDVWQWWSPMTAVPGSGGWIPADGWVVDPYFKQNPEFRRYIRKYLATGLPLVVMPWASTTAKSPPMTPAQWQINNDQLDVAVEFNLPVAFYWTYGLGTSGGTSCNYGCDRGHPKTEWDRINQWVWDYISRVRAIPRDYAGLDSADIGRGDTLEIGVTGENNRLVYTDDYGSSKCIDDASMAGFRDLVMDGESLSARGFRGRDTDASLTYYFAGDFPATSPKVAVSATTNKAMGGQVEIALSANGKTWPHSVASSSAESQRLELSSDGDKQFASLHEFWVRIRLSSAAGSDPAPPAGIDDLRIEAGVLTPKEPSVRLKPLPENPDTLIYEDDFQTQKYRSTTTRTNDNHLEWRRGAIGVRMRPGGSHPGLVWHVKTDDPLHNIVVDVTGQANNGSLGTNHFLDVSTDGKTWSNEVSTAGRKYNVSGWAGHGLMIDLSENAQFREIREFYVRLRLRAESYKEVHQSQSGTITKVRFNAETLKE